MDDCIFCKIAKGELPCYKVYEDDLYLGFLDIKPKAIGHCLLIPKIHFRRVYDVDNMGQYFETAKIIINNLLKNLKSESVIIKAVGEEVAHAHIQLIPHGKIDTELSNLSLDDLAVRINS